VVALLWSSHHSGSKYLRRESNGVCAEFSSKSLSFEELSLSSWIALVLSVWSSRDTDVVIHLAGFRYLTRSQIKAFLFEGSTLKPHSMEIQAGRILDRLKAAGLVTSTQRLIGGPGGGSAGLVYFLTPDGQKLADALTGSPKRRPPHSGSFLMRHGQMTAAVALAFRRAARVHPGHELVEWECDWAAAERLGSSYVVPDARMEYETPKWVLSAFIEVDLATEGTRFFARKIDRYLRLYLNGSWRQHLSVWPIILTVTPSDERASALKAATAPLVTRRYYGLRLSGIVECWFTSLGALVGPHGPLGPIWQIAGRDGVHALVDDLDEGVMEVQGSRSVGTRPMSDPQSAKAAGVVSD
jgi:hypothetical protein